MNPKIKCACVFPRACTLNWRDIHHMLAADRSSLEKSMQKETPVERRESVVWPQRRDHSRASDLQWSEGRALSGYSVVIEADRSEQSERSFSGSREKCCRYSVVIEADRSKQSERSFSGSREVCCLATVSSSKQIGASRASDLQWSKGKELSRRRHA